MNDYIQNFTNQLEEAIEIGKNAKLNKPENAISNIVLCGLGGSGIGGSLTSEILEQTLSIPFLVNKKYSLPAFIDKNTLVLISSYSGNTEETLEAFEKAMKTGAKIVGVSSNGKVEEICKSNGFDFIKIPGGMPPRACLAYSFVQQFYALAGLGLIDYTFENEFNNAITLMRNEEADIKKQAQELAEHIYNKLPIIYAPDHMEALAIRWRQQINENGKQLCWHHAIPEMNHNELVGWREKNENLAVVFLRNDNDYNRVAQRIELNKEIIKQYTPNIYEVWSKGNSHLERVLYVNNIGDWLSFYLSEKRNFDPIEVKVIDFLKGELAKM